MPVRKKITKFVVTDQLNIPLDDERVLVIVSERLTRPRINFNSSNDLASGEFKTKAESARTGKRVQNIQHFALFTAVAVHAVGQ